LILVIIQFIISSQLGYYHIIYGLTLTK